MNGPKPTTRNASAICDLSDFRKSKWANNCIDIYALFFGALQLRPNLVENLLPTLAGVA